MTAVKSFIVRALRATPDLIFFCEAKNLFFKLVKTKTFQETFISVVIRVTRFGEILPLGHLFTQPIITLPSSFNTCCVAGN
jgi:hypothetical protein